MPLLSVIIPVYNEAENILPLHEELLQYLPADHEILFIDDGSTDNTPLILQELCSRNEKVRSILFSRNFGHQNALMAGLNFAKGDNIITMDGDFQHPPGIIPAMLKELDSFDIVGTKRNRTLKIGLIKKMYSAIFYRLINTISETKVEPNGSDFRAFNKKVLQSILLFKERDLFLRGIFSWIGFKSTVVIFEAPERRYGKTKYSFGKMLKLALKGITAFSFKPLRVALLIGSIISFAAFAFGLFALVEYYQGNTVPGWASIIIGVMFLGGTQLLAIGLLGEYIASLFTETKHRPLYIIDKRINI